MFWAGLWLALAALGGCGAESHLPAAEAAAAAPLPEPAEIDQTQSGGICDEGPDGLSILRSPPGISLVSDFRRGGSVQEFSGLVLNLLDELPAATAQYFDPSIVDRGRKEPAIDLTVFPSTASEAFWTVAPSAEDSIGAANEGAWYVLFQNGTPHEGFARAAVRVRCVR
jgi:hypothetical protein